MKQRKCNLLLFGFAMLQKRITVLVLLLFFAVWGGFSGLCLAQPLQFRYWQGSGPRVWVGADTLKQPFAGGLNAPQFSRVHLDADATEDLLVFDRASHKTHTYLARGSGFVYAPDYEYLIPESYYWILARDYNCDGRKDLWIGMVGGLNLYKNQTDAQGNAMFLPVAMPLISTSYSGSPLTLSVDATDIPAIADLDNDGDLDLICFEFAGSAIELHKNMAIENNLGCGALPIMVKSGCWGGLLEGNTCGSFSFGLSCRSGSDTLVGQQPTYSQVLHPVAHGPQAPMHAGSSLLTLPLNSDNLPDLLLGDVSCPGLYGFLNTGSIVSPAFLSFIQNFPQTAPVNIHTFPAAFYLDIDMDNKPELLAAPNLFYNEGNQTDFRNSAWLYKNNALAGQAPIFALQKKNFLQDLMIDLGENAAPAFVDIDQDNDVDMIVGHRGTLKANGQFSASLYFYRNIGSRTIPVFSLEDTNFLSLSSQNLRFIKPIITDFDTDGRPDLLLSTTASNSQTGQIRLYYHQNTVLPYNSPVVLAIPAGAYDTPAAADIDQDGKTDILLAKSFGSLYYYKNTATNQNPAFTLQSPSYLGITNTGFAYNLSVCIADINTDGRLDLLRTDATGIIRVHSDFLAPNPSPADTMILANLVLNRMISSQFGNFASIAVAQLNADSLPDIAVGLSSGGIVLLKNHSGQPLKAQKRVLANQIRYYPNPATELLELQSELSGSLHIHDLVGRELMNFSITKGKNTIVVSQLQAGLYVLSFQNQNVRMNLGKLKIR